MSAPEEKHVDAAAPADAPAAAPEGELTEKDRKKLEKAAKKEAEKAAKAAKKAEQAAKQAAAQAVQFDPATFGPSPIVESREQTGTQWTGVQDIVPEMEGQEITVRARIHNSRKASAKLCFLVLRKKIGTVQCVLSEGTGLTRDHIKWVASLPLESVVDVVGKVVTPSEPVKACTQSLVELQVTKTFLVSSSNPVLPFQLADAAGLTEDIVVSQDTRLDSRWLDMRTPANNAIWTLKGAVCKSFRAFLGNNSFTEIQTPKIIPAASESGASVFKLGYFDTNAYLAQSPQLYKQMALMGDLERVFEVGPVFRAENANTHRHLCEFVGLDVEMEIKEHYYEVLDVAEGLFTYIFDTLKAEYAPQVQAFKKQWDTSEFVHKMTDATINDLKLGIIHGDEKRESGDEYKGLIYDRSVATLRMTYPNAVRLLNTQLPEGEKMGETEDLSTPNEKLLGKLVKERYGVDFFIVDWFPQEVRPFYTMPCPHDNRFSNSYDMFMRGEEISSGAQRIHDVELLRKRGAEMEIDMATMKDYVESFTLGAWPHGGFGVGLERVVMLYLGIHNIRACSMFPRTPNRNTP
eukprot:TRINITY_DN65_c3_g1_i1.p1 TRINITY_DN65_c3_g1~~TRINITY_DN65_c3_g1_i1.p1  ORF type:complete len:576 (+),score=298.13 TRINITY_DN65_c3_g1_i1:48-1775(+)